MNSTNLARAMSDSVVLSDSAQTGKGPCFAVMSLRHDPSRTFHISARWLLTMISLFVLCVMPRSALALQPAPRPPCSRDDDAIGFISRTGTLAVKPVYSGAGDFGANGLAPVAVNSSIVGSVQSGPSHSVTRWGYIDRRGKMVISPVYRCASNFGTNRFALVHLEDVDGSAAFIRADGSPSSPLHFETIYTIGSGEGALEALEPSHAMVPAESGNKWGYVNPVDRWVIPPRYDDAGPFSDDGMAAVSQNGKWGYINTRGEFVIRPAFEEAGAFGEKGLAVVRRDGYLGFIRRSGAVAIPPSFDYLGLFAPNGLAWAMQRFKCGYIDLQGKWAIKPRFSECMPFGEGSPSDMARVELGDASSGNVTFAWIDEKGHFVINPMPADHFNKAEFSQNGLMAYFVDDGGKALWGYIDNHGHTVIKPQFFFAADFGANGLARVTNVAMKTGYVDAKGAFVIAPDLDCAYDFAPDGLARALRRGHWGFIDRTGKMIVKSPYMPITDFASSGYALVSAKEKAPENGQCWYP